MGTAGGASVMVEQRCDVVSISASDDEWDGIRHGEKVYTLLADLVGGMGVLHLGARDGRGSDLLATQARSVTAVETDAVGVSHAPGRSRRRNLEFIGGPLSRSGISALYNAVVALKLTTQMPNLRQTLSELSGIIEDDAVAWVSMDGEKVNPGSGAFDWLEYLKGFFLDVRTDLAGAMGELTRHTDSVIYECRRPRRIETGLTSIVIPVKGLWHYTQGCLDSIRSNTPETHEIIVVDNASDDETASELAKLSDIRVVTNRMNLGFGGASNQGIRESRGEYVLLLNNDTVVTPRWLGRMLAHITKPGVGAVGPMSNHTLPDQEIDFSPQGPDELIAFAAELGRTLKGRARDVPYLSGLCLLVRREVIETVGGLDLRFGLGNWEDADIGIRAVLAGYRLRLARDVFIHHYGGQTTVSQGLDRTDLLLANWELFKQKWGVTLDDGKGIGLDRLAEEVLPGVDQILSRDHHWHSLFDGSVWHRPNYELGVR